MELQQELDDLDYNEKQALLNLHILPDEYEKQDYFEFTRVLLAKSPDERCQDIDTFF